MVFFLESAKTAQTWKYPKNHPTKQSIDRVFSNNQLNDDLSPKCLNVQKLYTD